MYIHVYMHLDLVKAELSNDLKKNQKTEVTCKHILRQSLKEAPSMETCPHIQSINLLHPISLSKGKPI